MPPRDRSDTGHQATAPVAAQGSPFRLRDYQHQALAAIHDAAQAGCRRQLVVLPTGTGKAQPVDEPVLTPAGWRPIGTLRPGHFVIGASGRPTRVLDVFPQGLRPVAQVRFSDDAQTRCDWEHLWAVATKTHRFENRSMRRGRTVPRPWRIRTLRQLVEEGLTDGDGWRHHVPLVEPVEHQPVALPLDPYLLGVLLGDGGLSISGRVLLHTQDDLAASLPLPAGVHLARLGDEGRDAGRYLLGGRQGRSANPVLDALRTLGLQGRRAHEKFVPEIYKRSAADDRLALLQGLLDADGSVDQRGSVEYTTVSAQLAADGQELIRSLGGVARIRTKDTAYTHKGERRAGRTAYRLHVALPHGANPVRWAPKLSRWRPPSKYQPTRTIVAVEDSEPAECVCIAVDAPDQLYLTRDHIVTHNTIIFANLVAGRAGRALVLAHREELLAQAASKLHLVDPAADIGVVKAERDQPAARVVVASVPTLAVPGRLRRVLAPGGFETLVVDEAHHAPAETWRGVLERVGAFTGGDGGPLVVGFTATADRGDGVGLGGVFERVVFERDLLAMIQGGYLCDLRALRVGLELDWQRVRVRNGDYAAEGLGAALEAANAPQLVADAYAEHAADRKALLFTPTVRLAERMADALRARGIAAEALDGTTPADQRRETLARLRTGRTQVVTNCALLAEGFDEPSVDCVVVARPTRSRPLLVQMLGRGTRLFPGKRDCLVLDVVAASDRHELVTVASLAGLERDALDQGTTLGQAVADRAREEDLRPAVAGRLVAREVDLFARHRFHWIRAGRAFALSVGNGQLVLEPTPTGTWRIVQQADGRRRLLAQGLSLEDAQGVAEEQVRARRAERLVDPNADWRARPATERQLAALAGRGIRAPAGLTRGQASDLLGAAIATGSGQRRDRSRPAPSRHPNRPGRRDRGWP
jgi:ATP-dependent helicase IRC3